MTNLSRCSVIDKDGKVVNYVWCEKRKQLVIDKSMNEPVVIYSNGSQECERMGMLLKALEGEYHEYLLGVHFSDKQFRMEFGSEATYPQCAIGNQHVGSMKETLQYMSNRGMFL